VDGTPLTTSELLELYGHIKSGLLLLVRKDLRYNNIYKEYYETISSIFFNITSASFSHFVDGTPLTTSELLRIKELTR
jgi:hypothetical protein